MSPVHRCIQPAQWPRPTGYSNAVLARGTSVFVAGQIGWNDQGRIVSEDFVEQTAQALRNIVTVLAAADAAPEHLVRMTWYVTNKAEYLSASEEIGRVYREIIGRLYPAMTLVEVSALLEDGAKVEIEATAVIPE